MLTLRSRHRSFSVRVLSRVCALTVAALAASPFTAPFSTFDLGLLLAGNALHSSTPVEGPSHAPSIADAVFVLASSDIAQEDLKDLALAVAAPLPFAPGVHAPRRVVWPTSLHLDLSLTSSPVLRI